MAQEHQGSHGKSFGSRKPGGRGGKGFKPRGRDGGKSFGRSERGHKPFGKRDGGSFEDRRGGAREGYRKHDGARRFEERREDGQERRSFHRDGQGGRRDGARGGYRGGRAQQEGGKFRKDGRFGEHRGQRDDRRGDSERRSFRRDDRGGRGGQGRSGGYGERRYQRDDRRDSRDTREPRQSRQEFAERAESHDRGEHRNYREEKRQAYLSKPRMNSDGTISFPSQNPYTHRRPDEPKMPKGMEWSMLSKDERERLRGLSKEHAENIGLHILAAFAVEESDPQNALAHAKWAARQASRIDFARETLGFIAYRQGDYKLAARELRTAYRMNGFLDYLPFIADCERGMEEPKKAIEIALSPEASQLRGEGKAEMFLVYAGALGDLQMWDKAVEIVHVLGRSKGLPGAYRMRAIQAEQYFLEESGQSGKALALEPLLERLELQYADVDEDESDEEIIIDYDLQHMTEDVLEEIGITPEDAQYAPEDEVDEDEDANLDGEGEADAEVGASEAFDEVDTSDEANADEHDGAAEEESADSAETEASGNADDADESDEEDVQIAQADAERE